MRARRKNVIMHAYGLVAAEMGVAIRLAVNQVRGCQFTGKKLRSSAGIQPRAMARGQTDFQT